MTTRRDFLKYAGMGTLGVAGLSLTGRMARAENPKIWFNTHFHGGDAEAMEIIMKKKINVGVDVDLTQGGMTDYYARVYSSVMAGQAPNMAICHDFRFLSMHPVYYNLAQTPIGNIFDLLGVSEKDFDARAWNIAHVDGQPYGVPIDYHPFGLYYNKTIFKQAGLDPENPPKTRADFEAACEAIKKTGKIPFHPTLSAAPRFIRRVWFMLYWGLNGKLLDGDQAAFNNDKGREALQYLVDMVNKRGWNKPGTDANNQFLAGELGMCFNGSWFLLTAEKSGIDYGMGEIPIFFDRQTTYSGTHNFALPKQPEGAETEQKLKNVVKVIRGFLDHDYLWGQLGGHIQSYLPGLNDPRLRESDAWDKTLKSFAAMMANKAIMVEPRHPKIVEIQDAINPNTEAAYNGTISVEEALNRAEKSVNEVMKS